MLKLVEKLNLKLKAYAAEFSSFLIKKLGEDVQKIDQIILFGSVAKGTATKESDVDIFVDTEKKPELEEKTREILEEFYESKEYTSFRAKGVDNQISLRIGELEDWEELNKSIISTGKVLWGNYRVRKTPEGTKHKLLVYWDKIGKKRTSFLNKIYGFETEERKVKGMIEEWNGKKTGKSSILVPFKYKEEFFGLLEDYGVSFSAIEVFVTE